MAKIKSLEIFKKGERSMNTEKISDVAQIFKEAAYKHSDMDTSALKELVIWCLKSNSIDDASLKGDEPSIHHLSHNLKQMADQIESINPVQAIFVRELYDLSVHHPNRIRLISIFEEIISRWDLICDSTYTYRCLTDLIELKKNWNLNSDEINELDEIMRQFK